MTGPLKPADYAEDKLWLGGALVFCSAVLVQLLQLQALSRPLWIALYSCAIALPLLASSLIAMQLHATFKAPVFTWAAFLQQHIGLLAAYICALALFWHFHWGAAAILFAATFVSLCLAHWDQFANERANRPPNTGERTEP